MCVSLVPPGTLNPPPAQTPKSQGWPSSGLEDWALARRDVVRTSANIAPRRRGGAENSEGQMTLEGIEISRSTRESIRFGTENEKLKRSVQPYYNLETICP